MPPLTAELAGIAAIVGLLLLTALVVDPRIRARRADNRLTRKTRRVHRHAAQGCEPCRASLGLPTRITATGGTR